MHFIIIIHLFIKEIKFKKNHIKMLKNSILLYISFFTITLCYNYKEVSQYENVTFFLTVQNPFIIYKFNNQPYQQNEGSIDIFFQKNSYSNIKVYIYDEFSKIQEKETKGEFMNYIADSRVNSNSRLVSFSKFQNRYYYIIISTPNYNYRDSIMIFNSASKFQFFNDKIFCKEFLIFATTKYFNFLTPLFSSKKYLHFMAYKNKISNYESKLTINEGIEGNRIYYLEKIMELNFHKIFQLKPNINYEIIFYLNVPYNKEDFKLSIYFSDYNYVEPLDKYDNYLEIPIIIDMMIYYIHLEVDAYDENENIYFKFNKYYYNNGLNFYGKFYETTSLIEIENNLPSKEDSNKIVQIKTDIYDEPYGFVNKTNRKYNSLVIALENSYIHRYENFKIWKYSHPQKITSNLSKTFKYTILKAFYIDESSFNTNSQYIILFSLIENIIHISTNSTIFYNKKSKLYVINKHLISSLPDKRLDFEIYNQDKRDFYFEIKYIDDVDIYYFNEYNREKMNNLEIHYKNCSKKTYLFLTFIENNKKNIFDFNIIKGKIKIYNQIDKIISKIDNLFNFNNNMNLITYSKQMDSNYDLFQFSCESPTKIKINYYNAEDTLHTINLEKGKSYQFYIKENNNETYNINLSSQSSILHYNIMIINKNIPSTINFYLNNNKLELTEKKPSIKGEIEKIKTITIYSNVEILIFFYIATDRNIFQSIYLHQKNKDLQSKYTLFLYSKNYLKHEFLNFYIINNGEINTKICIHKENDLISNTEKWIFLESNCFILSKLSKYYLYLDNPFLNGKDDEMNYISLYTNNYNNILYDYEYREVTELKSYENYNVILSENLFYQIFKYYNNQTLKEGEIRVLFNEKITNKFPNLYVYYDKTFIHESFNVFDNYIYEKQLNKIITYNAKDNSYLPIGYWYFVIATNLGNKYEDNFIMFNQDEYYILSEKIFSFEYYINNYNYYVSFKIPAFPKYLTLHYEWYNNLNECTNSIIINNEQISDLKHSISDNYEIKDKSKENIIKINFKTSKIGVYSKVLLYLTEHKKILYLTNDFKPIKIKILSPQIIYIFNDISNDNLNENIYYQLNGCEVLSNPKIKFYNTNNLDSISNLLPTSLEQFDFDLEIYENNTYYYNKINENNKYAILGIQVPYSNLNEFTFQKINFPRLVNNNLTKIFLKNETKYYFINEESFPNKDIKILLFAERNDIISFKGIFEHKFLNKKKLYLITYDMLKESTQIEFSISDPSKSKDYLFEIRYLDNSNIYYYNKDSRFELNNMKYEINDCSKMNYIIGLYETIDLNTVFYINIKEGDAKILYNTNIDKIDDLQLSHKYLYKYPFLINSFDDYIQIYCMISSIIEINFYKIQTDKVINLEKGNIFPFYIEKDQNLDFSIEEKKFLFMNKFFSKIILIPNYNEIQINIEIIFDNITSNLNNNNSYVETYHEKIQNKTILFNCKNSNCFILLYISLDKNSINYIKNNLTNSKFTKSYNIFVFPLHLISNINSMANIYIINKENEFSSDICLNKNYGHLEKIYKEKINCMKFKKGENITISLIYENLTNIINEEINYYIMVYTENIKDFEYSFNFYTYSNIISYQSFNFNIEKNNYIILSFENKKFNKFNEELIGEIMFKFEKGKVNGSNLYIYEDKKEIHSENNFFDNYISKIDLSKDYLFTYNYSKIVKYYFVINSNENDFNDKIIIYNPIIPFELNIMKIFNTIYETDLISDSFLFYFNNTNNSNSINFHYQWSNQQLDSNSTIIFFNSTFYEEKKSYIQKSDYFEFYNNSEYYILITEDNTINKKRIFLNLLFYFSQEKNIFFIERNILRTLPIISTQSLHFYINIEKLAKGEDEYIKVKKINEINIKYYVKFYEHNNLDEMNSNDYDNQLILEDCDNNYCKYSFEKINNNHKSAIIIVEINSNKYINYTNFEILLIDDYKLLYKSFIKEFSKDDIGKYLINEKTFKNSHTIIIKSDIEGVIYLNNSHDLYLLNGKKVYVFTRNNLKNISEIYLSLHDKNKEKEFKIEILTLNNNFDIQYFNFNTKQDNSKIIKIEKNNKFKGFISLYNISEKVILYVDIIKGDPIIYYKNSINDLNEFLTLNKSSNNLYVYPSIYESNYDFIQIECSKYSEIKFIFYEIFPNEIELKFGISIPLFIENKKTMNYIIKDESEILNKKIKYRIELIPSEYYSKSSKVIFGDINYEINDKNKYIQNISENFKEKSFNINSIEGDILLFLSIGINNEDINYYSNAQFNKQLEEKYNIFSYSNEKLNSSNYSNIHIMNKGKIKKKICYSFLFNNFEYIFPRSENNCNELNENEHLSIIFDNPKMEKNNKNEQFFYIVYVEDPLNLIFDYSYITYNEIYNNQLNNISFSADKKYEMFYFNYENIGDILLKFDEKLDEGTKFYLYYEKEKIIFNSNNFGGDIILSKNINNLNQFLFSVTQTNFYFIIFNDKGINNKKFLLIGNEIMYEISNSQTYLNYYTSNQKQYSLNYKINKVLENVYLNIQWKIEDSKSNCSIIIYNNNIKEPIYQSTQKTDFSDFIPLEPNIEYKLLFNVFSYINDAKIDLLFNFNEKSNIISFIKDEIISLPIISNQIIYLIQPIKSYSLNENINYAISDINIDIKVMIKFFDKSTEKEIINEINSIKEYDKILEKDNCEEKICYYLNKKIDNAHNYLLIKIDLKSLSNLYEKNSIFTIQKHYIPLEIKSSISYEMEKYSKKLFKFNYDSVLINQTIIIYSNNENSISIVNNNKYGFSSGKKLYVINKEMTFNNMIFQIYNDKEDYKVNIEYISKDKIIYYRSNENRNKISNYRIKINDCQKENYYYGAFNKKNDEIIYVEVVYGDSKIYSIESSKISSINDLYNFNKIDNELSYPKLIKNEYDILQFVCTQPSLINIYYYDYQIKEIILNYGDSYGIYIKNGIKKIKIRKDSEIYNNSFSFEIKLIYSNKKTKNARIRFNNKNYNLENKNDLIRDINEKISDEEIELESYNEDTLILIKIGLNKTLSTYIKEEKKEIIPDKNYIIILYPKNNEQNKYISSIIIIENIKPFNSGKICLSEGFNGEKYIELPQNKDCISLNKGEKISFNTPYPYKDKVSLRRLNEDYDNYFYSKFYFENPQNLKISYTLEKMKEEEKKENNNNNKSSKTWIIIIIVLLIIIIIAVILYFLFKRKEILISKPLYIFDNNEKKKEMEVIDNIKDLKVNNIDDYPSL